MDETTKIKKLKEQEALDLKKSATHKKAFLFSISAILLITCLLVGGFASYALLHPTPSMVTPTSSATKTLLEDSFRLSISSLSMTIPTNSSSTLSFTITRTASDTNSLCTGEFEIRNLSQVKKLYEEGYTERIDSSLEGVMIGITAYDEKTAHTIGDDRPLFDGSIGQTNFNAGNEPDFSSIANRFTDGVNDWVILNTTFLQENGPQGGTSKGIHESEYFQSGTDLTGHSVDLIQRDIHQLIIQPNYYTFDVTWSFWEYTGQSNDAWIQISPDHGTVNSLANQEIIVSFNSTGLPSGSYTTDLLVDFGRGCSMPVSVPATMIVR